ncbi:MAG: hypothetical protein ABR520_05960 [Mycobacteriales bacterium]
MWEYRWVETIAGTGEATELSRLGADGWEAVTAAQIGVHFGETWVRVLLKRERSNSVVDLRQADSRTARAS